MAASSTVQVLYRHLPEAESDSGVHFLRSDGANTQLKPPVVSLSDCVVVSCFDSDGRRRERFSATEPCSSRGI